MSDPRALATLFVVGATLPAALYARRRDPDAAVTAVALATLLVAVLWTRGAWSQGVMGVGFFVLALMAAPNVWGLALAASVLGASAAFVPGGVVTGAGVFLALCLLLASASVLSTYQRVWRVARSQRPVATEGEVFVEGVAQAVAVHPVTGRPCVVWLAGDNVRSARSRECFVVRGDEGAARVDPAGVELDLFARRETLEGDTAHTVARAVGLPDTDTLTFAWVEPGDALCVIGTARVEPDEGAEASYRATAVRAVFEPRDDDAGAATEPAIVSDRGRDGILAAHRGMLLTYVAVATSALAMVAAKMAAR